MVRFLLLSALNNWEMSWKRLILHSKCLPQWKLAILILFFKCKVWKNSVWYIDIILNCTVRRTLSFSFHTFWVLSTIAIWGNQSFSDDSCTDLYQWELAAIMPKPSFKEVHWGHDKGKAKGGPSSVSVLCKFTSHKGTSNFIVQWKSTWNILLS